MTLAKPRKTLADHLVIYISPVLIMMLVGSLSFFLIKVFFRGEAAGSVRWVIFWFVLAVVLVARIGIEQGKTQATVYGALLAMATWFYLIRIHPAFILGALLLAIVWWCAHKLTWDCTLIDEDEDASGGGLLETSGEQNKKILPPPKKAPWGERRKEKTSPHSPGMSVVYFSLAALPIFGIGQMLIQRGDAVARRAAFIYLFLYVAAALGLLLTTSFLGLRRYLRQRYLEMPGTIALGWMRVGVGTGALVLAGALLLPRPGANAAWVNLRYHIDHQLRAASNYAMKFSPHGKGEGRPGSETSEQAKKTGDTSKPENAKEKSQGPGDSGKAQPQESPAAARPVPGDAGQLYPVFKIVFLLVVAVVVVWWLYRNRELLLQMARAFWAAIAKFFADLSGLITFRKREDQPAKIPKAKPLSFQSYHNPFLTGGEDSWTHEKLVLYSFEALQAWAEERGIQSRPEQTAREFCEEVGSCFPEINSELYGLSFLYGHAAYGISAPAKYDLDPVKSLWQFFYRGTA
jgi:hypothetical protein